MRKNSSFLGALALMILFVSCSKGDSEKEGGGDACWYRLVLDGQTVEPNRFGQDRLVLTSGADVNDPAEQAFGFRIDQAKSGGSDPAILNLAGPALLNSQLAPGVYPAAVFSTTAFHTGGFALWPFYGFAADDHNDLGQVNVELLENSDRQIRVKASGLLTRYNEDFKKDGMADMTLEITMGRKHYAEMSTQGVLGGGAVCDCK
ncbi:hypothetical protein [Niabella terrae]